jgi:hypothetical protein
MDFLFRILTQDFPCDGKEFWRNTSIREERWVNISISNWDFHLSRSVGLIKENSRLASSAMKKIALSTESTGFVVINREKIFKG